MRQGILERAEAVGLQVEYTSAQGEKRRCNPEAVKALLNLMKGRGDYYRLSPLVAVLWNGKGTLGFNRPLPSHTRLFLENEQGELLALDYKSSSSVTEIEITGIPFGYYQGILETRKGFEEFLVISAPKKCYSAFENEKGWGLFIPAYALHSKKTWGAGNLTDLGNFAEWLADKGGRAACTLPLLDCFLDKPFCEPSPYAPATRLFWNEFYLDIEKLPEFPQNRKAVQLVKSARFQKEISALRSSPLVDYNREYKLRRSVLELLALDSHPVADAGLKEYARFRAACDYFEKPWGEWPSRLKYNEKDYKYYLYVQLAVTAQLNEVASRARAKNCQMFLDLPVGVHPSGYDVWKNQKLFLNNTSVGAPPDAFFTKGQNWGFPPLNPVALRASRYKYLRDYLGFLMRTTGLLRIDHVMSLHRLWCVPNGMEATDGVYLRYNIEEQFAILALESWKHKCTVVGENLGTVPKAINKAMERNGVRGMYVFQFGLNGKSRKPVTDPPAKTVAYVNTHDMPTLKGFLTGKEIGLRQELGLVTPEQALSLKKQRKATAAALSRYFKSNDLLAGSLRLLGKSKAELIIANLEDLWGEANAQNVPGTTNEHPNWRRKAKLSLEQIARSKKLNDLLKSLSRPQSKIKR